MNRLNREQRGQANHLLCEANSIRAITRLTGISKTMVFDPADVDFAQLQKRYGPSYKGSRNSTERRYSPPICIGAERVTIYGNPNPDHISTSYVERNNLNVRMHSRRMTRLTNAFLKKLANHRHALALHFLYHNFVRVQQNAENDASGCGSRNEACVEIH